MVGCGGPSPSYSSEPYTSARSSRARFRRVSGPGTYWVDFQYAGVSFTPPVNPGSSPGNAVLFLGTSSTWNPLIDTGSQLQQEVPFLIDYTVAPAPGCLALLAVGGLMAKRRRRS